MVSFSLIEKRLAPENRQNIGQGRAISSKRRANLRAKQYICDAEDSLLWLPRSDGFLEPYQLALIASQNASVRCAERFNYQLFF